MDLDDAVYTIQRYYREKQLLRKVKFIRKKDNLVVTSSIDTTGNIYVWTMSIKSILQFNQIQFKVIDIVNDKDLQMKLKGKQLPAVFMNDYYLGDYKDFMKLVDQQVVQGINEQQYEYKCLYCNDLRENCHCKQHKLFFSKPL